MQKTRKMEEVVKKLRTANWCKKVLSLVIRCNPITWQLPPEFEKLCSRNGSGKGLYIVVYSVTVGEAKKLYFIYLQKCCYLLPGCEELEIIPVLQRQSKNLIITSYTMKPSNSVEFYCFKLCYLSILTG